MSAGLLTIDLGALAANYKTIRSLMPEGGEAAAVLKGDAYGLGVEEVAPALTAAGTRTFFVALPEEGERLRRFVPTDAVIYILSGPVTSPWGGSGPQTLEIFRRAGLRPVLSTPEQVAAWTGAGLGEHPYAVQVESGMNRLGLPAADAVALAPGLRPALVMSHLACSDDPAHPQNAEQLRRFTALRAHFPGVRASLAASGGSFLGPEYRFDLVRPGIALYGGNPQPAGPSPVQPVVSLEVAILQVRRVDTPGAVGYGAAHNVQPGAILATIAAGYADGLFRTLSGRGFGVLAGKKVPMVGRVSMDLITFDVSEVPGVKPGDAITLIGAGHGLDDLAGEGQTISYEILTSLGPRYARRYCDTP